jgi:hypothetical protein
MINFIFGVVIAGVVILNWEHILPFAQPLLDDYICK